MSFEKITLLQRQLEETQRALNEAYEEAKILLQVDRAELRNEQAGWEALANKLDRSLLPNRIKLDVGGTIFATSKSTLLAQKNSFFEGMFGGRFDTKPENDGTYFIDRNPLVFGIILDHMRGQKVKLEKLSEDEFDTLKEDAEFYQLPGLVALFEELEKPKIAEPKFEWKFIPGPNYTLSYYDTIAAKSIEGGLWNAVVKGSELPCQGIIRWKFAITQTYESNLYLGVAPVLIDQYTDEQQVKCGFYMSAANSYLYAGPHFSYRGFQYGSGRPICSGQVVGVQVNTVARTVEFFVDGQSLGVAYYGIPVDAPLCPCVLMNTPQDTIEIHSWD